MSSILAVTNAVKSQWPEHATFIDKRFDQNHEYLFPDTSEHVAAMILRLTGSDLPQYCDDYKWMCGNIFQEEVFFRKNKHYRLSSQKEAYEKIYNNPDYMSRYINGLLLSQLLWSNQTAVIDYFNKKFLHKIKPSSRYLEIGPGHGLFLSLADQSGKLSSVEAWDISQSSLASTRHALDTLGASDEIALKAADVTVPNPTENKYDSVVISEVLEHLDNPSAALKSLMTVMEHEGLIFINIPVNSPAPDHIHLWRTPESFIEFVQSCGLDILDSACFPATGHTLEQARKRDITINVCVTAQKR